MAVRGHSSAIITWYRCCRCVPTSPGEILQTPRWCVPCPDPPLPHILRPLFRQSVLPVSLSPPTTVAAHSRAYTNSCKASAISIQHTSNSVLCKKGRANFCTLLHLKQIHSWTIQLAEMWTWYAARENQNPSIAPLNATFLLFSVMAWQRMIVVLDYKLGKGPRCS